MLANIIKLLIALSIITPALQLYCSTACADYLSACFDDTPNGCYACAPHVFNLSRNMTSANPSCSLLTQNSMIYNELPNLNMALTGYTSSKPSPITCTNYTFSGQYTNQDFISKNFTNIPTNHYSIIIRFSVGYIGTWTTNDVLRLTLQDQTQSVIYDYNYSCDSSQNICGEVGVNTSDCIRIREYTVTHNSSYVFLNFSALTTESDPTIQFWGIKELYVVGKMCHAYCLTCYGPANSNCLSCSAGYYLEGNVCVQSCSSNFYALALNRMCLTNCPAYYYGYTSSADSTKTCLSCAPNCILCTEASTCQAWSNQQAYVPNLWKDKQQFWILLMIMAVSLVGFAIFKIIKKNLPASEIEEPMVKSDQEKSAKSQSKQKPSDLVQNREALSVPNESMVDSLGASVDIRTDNLWFNELLEMQPTEIKVRGRRNKTHKPPSPQNHMQEIPSAIMQTTSNLDL